MGEAKWGFSLVNLLCALSLFINFTTSLSAVSSNDAEVMRKLSTLLNAADWNGDPCEGSTSVNCVDGRVVAINLNSKNKGGSLPSDLNKLTELKTLALQNNGLTGPLPSLANLSKLERIFLDGNNFTSIPPLCFSGLVSLRTLSLNGNPFNPWTIPDDLALSTNLEEFLASKSGITGSIPEFLGQLPSLQSLRLSYNNLTGVLPASFGQSSIQRLWLNNQLSPAKLSGAIDVIASMTQAIQLWLHANSFMGPIPDLSNCTLLVDLQLRDNQLTGVLPASLFTLPMLVNVSLGSNKLQGPYPNFSSSVKLDDNVAENGFCSHQPGPCPTMVSILLSVEEGFGFPLRLADVWTGDNACSWSFVSCDSKGDMMSINLANQNLMGTISPAIANITTLKTLILSNNNLTGSIPESLTGMLQLQTIDVSNNNLSGKIPTFRTTVSFKRSGNPLLGTELASPGSSGLNASSGEGSSTDAPGTRKKSFLPIKWIVLIVGSFLLLALVVSFVIFLKDRKKFKGEQSPLIGFAMGKSKLANPSGKGTLLSKASQRGGDRAELQLGLGSVAFSIHVLRQVTNNFSDDNIVGKGGFGVVYKGRLQDGTEIAVKRMESAVLSSKGMGEFQAEIAVLTKVRHRHLVSLTGFCTEANERLLVYEYMPRGTLGQHLFETREHGYEPLTWKQRLTIVLDVARGVEYLHSLAQTSFIHRDLKPSNILLDNDMRAKVSDFGLVKLAPDGKYSVETKLAGTFGYLAPEYCTTGRVTTKVDVYSFGVILMEVITGRKALDETQTDDRVHLVTWFRRLVTNRDNLLKAIDLSLNLDREVSASIFKVAELAGHCTVSDPMQRPDMGHAVNVLSPLIEQWRPTGSEEDEGGLKFRMTLSQAVEQWQANEGNSVTADFIQSTDNAEASWSTSPQPFASNSAR